MGLSPEEEDLFSGIMSVAWCPAKPPIPWWTVMACVALVGLTTGSAVVLGLPGTYAIVFLLTFAVALALGLLLMALSDRRGASRAARFGRPFP
jgi:hypothetical protein